MPDDRDSPEVLYSETVRYLRNARDEGRISTEEYDAVTEFLDAYDEDTPSVPKPEGERHRTKKTLRAWANRLRRVATYLDVDLTEATADDVNRLWDGMMDGSHPEVKDGGLAKNTVTSYQSTVRMFYEYHDQFGVGKENIAVIAPEKETVTEDDVFNSDEIQAMRDEIEHPRNRCLFDLLLYTGQRIRAIQTLRVGDIDLQEETFYLNTDDGGLKGAEGKRPLLGAIGAVREWLKYHPNPEDDAYLICYREDFRNGHDAKETLSQRSINRTLKQIAEGAGIDPDRANAHNFRHTFVTIAKRRYDMDNDTIKGLIGHKAKSRVMEQTYSHLTDDDHIRAAQKSVPSIRDPEDDDESPLSPEFCTTCDEPLPDGAKSCPACGTVFTPDAHTAKERIGDAIHESSKEATTDQQKKEVDEIRRLFKQNPELVIEALDVDPNELM